MCRNHGCNTAQCVLCKHNPNKRCGVNFAGKYWVGDALLAKCEAEIDVEVLDEATQSRVDASELPAFGLEVCPGSAGIYLSCSFLVLNSLGVYGGGEHRGRADRSGVENLQRGLLGLHGSLGHAEP